MNDHYRFGSAFVLGFKVDGAEKLSTFKRSAVRCDFCKNWIAQEREQCVLWKHVKQSVFGIKVQYVEGEC